MSYAVSPSRRLWGNGRSRDEELSQLRRELARVTKERDFLREAAAFFAKADDPTMPRCVSHPIDVPLFAGIGQWVLWLGEPPAK